MSPVDYDQKFPETYDKEIVTKVLLANVVSMLQKMEAWMEGQEKRLSRIETIVRIGEEEEAKGINKPLPDPPSEQSSYVGHDVDNQHAHSTKVGKKRYEFEDSMSTLGDSLDESGAMDSSDGQDPQKHNVHPEFAWIGDRNDDGDSMSVYSGNVFESRAAPMPGNSQIKMVSQSNEIPTVPYETCRPGDVRTTSPGDVSVRSIPADSMKTALSGSSKRPHQNVEMTFYAYDNWKREVLSKITNEEGRRQRREMNRLRDLRPRPPGTLLSVVGRWLRSKVPAIQTPRVVLVN
jgi:hypothetical protein